MKVVPVILCGGSGDRLWPMSRKHYPKQFLPLASDQSMFQETALRIKDIHSEVIKNPVIVTNEDHKFLVQEQLTEIGLKNSGILIEPMARNTAPAISAAAFHIQSKFGDDAHMIIFPADHYIENKNQFSEDITNSIKHIEPNTLVTFGIKPSDNNINYGYIKKGTSEGNKSYSVEEFIEKPDSSLAASFIESGDYFWNSGIYLFNTASYLNLLKKIEPAMYDSIKYSYLESDTGNDFIDLERKSFLEIQSISIDYLVMENAIEQGYKLILVPIDVGWNDLGSWQALLQLGQSHEDNNVIKGDVILKDTKGSYFSSNKGLVVGLGLENMIVVRTSDVVLVAESKKSNEIGSIVKMLKKHDREEAILHRKVSRPWGTYECLEESGNFKVKRIIVKPGAKLSVQMHNFRSEHWVIVKGKAKVTNGDETLTLQENESTFIPVETKHSLENPGTDDLELIEVQVGSYLGEDDIVRFEDKYGRVN
ncbi:MAG: mannose-1-phosphate guanylyltransferase/mannose-6-phosphate isomerase [Gammaproteobacteria bacterium]|nr:mannose-1-phosphate guanylyltransferase/mannose-6-phosphate isomerase [Gammaproteobacteria bacterium]